MTNIPHPDDPALEELCRRLQARSNDLLSCGDWPGEQLRWCGQAGVYQWFMPRERGGLEWSAEAICRGYEALSRACLTTTFIITQYMGACQRIARSERTWVADQWLDQLRTGERFATVGISHLTTSRRHLAKPVLAAQPANGGYRLAGYSPWVTGACHADLIVTGATLPDQRQILCAVPTDAPGVHVPPPVRLVALSASCTGPVEFHDVWVPEEWLLAGPEPEVMKGGVGAGTGGIQTSTLALGLAHAAIDYLKAESDKRGELLDVVRSLDESWQAVFGSLLEVARGSPVPSAEELRHQANRLVLRATQAALTAAKGAGFVEGHPVGRWCREALFFLVWSCPQNVLQAHLCELAGLA
ncbi:MAG: hypothetical protein KatS3mg109_1013 [Pirellulaceae bacterium]|nr:MAG: hypothetical protein KatS3mg109_1013 [Pirellulaceae bacterium]